MTTENEVLKKVRRKIKSSRSFICFFIDEIYGLDYCISIKRNNDVYYLKGFSDEQFNDLYKTIRKLTSSNSESKQ